MSRENINYHIDEILRLRIMLYCFFFSVDKANLTQPVITTVLENRCQAFVDTNFLPSFENLEFCERSHLFVHE